jgi:hypothetical protein
MDNALADTALFGGIALDIKCRQTFIYDQYFIFFLIYPSSSTCDMSLDLL